MDVWEAGAEWARFFSMYSRERAGTMNQTKTKKKKRVGGGGGEKKKEEAAANRFSKSELGQRENRDTFRGMRPHRQSQHTRVHTHTHTQTHPCNKKVKQIMKKMLRGRIEGEGGGFGRKRHRKTHSMATDTHAWQ